MEEIILTFIEDFKAMHKEEIEDLFLNGYCYYFAIILHERFGRGLIMYIPIYNHFCYKIDENLYDISGKIKDEEKIKLAVYWERYKNEEYLDSERIIRDCICKIPSKYIP